ncbi:hypothetical protein [Lichenifustis flavocetrariae]|uniref:Uncharacterized protein n=1 Tax=Lichenifustis flavocetrariae TaxID=2949735 RepID=A0AA41Z6N2_9HYPH|nr:hypothetical protein [Lichenifustis flavocetrariae]MCW6511320.1 hypothetical protein [Lichenifustis flavocetrariae]
MIFLGLFVLATLVALTRYLFCLAVYTVPTVCGLGVAFVAQATGAGLLGAGLAGLLTSTFSLAAGRMLFARARSPLTRVLIGVLYVSPAFASGFGLSYELLAPGPSNVVWHVGLALLGGVMTGVVALQRLAAWL